MHINESGAVNICLTSTNLDSQPCEGGSVLPQNNNLHMVTPVKGNVNQNSNVNSLMSDLDQCSLVSESLESDIKDDNSAECEDTSLGD